ncbi:multicopper oxidase domain-containing protein [Desulfuromonas sp. TF]|uniref:multicopper oxidase domain-containing protein n=1 Tax=Desulfuromonas sp. TF TaxID=1232410 RepID=UPI0004827502|nr:multicopper oxidase domain-containing protein [Desulfuromonas sp. TF]
MKVLKRRQFLKYSGLGLAAIYVGGCGGGGGGGGNGGTGGDDDDLPAGGGNDEVAATLNFTITDAVKEMITHEPLSQGGGEALCYFWAYQVSDATDPENVVDFPVDCPGPQIFATEGDRIALRVTNTLDVPHAFFIEGLVDSGPIEPGETWEGEFEAKDTGVFLYHDNLNAPVNRVMGLHGALVVMPKEASGDRWTPYKDPTQAVQQLFDDFGSAPWWPGLAWEEGDVRPASFVEPFRQYVWLCHQASPVLFAEVGRHHENNPGVEFDAATFVEAFLNDPFINTSNDPRTDPGVGLPKTENFNRKPHFFTINGQSGFFAHHNPAITPFHRIGEPTLVRILNAGMTVHSLHLHANHFFVTAVNNEAQENPLWVDVYNVFPMDHVDYTIPFMRPPDIPNQRGIGRADAGRSTAGGGTTWPPLEEFDRFFPPQGTMVQSYDDPNVLVDVGMRQSPLCYPMHDHTEASQTAQGGNYNSGMIAGIYFIGDRNTPGQMNFPLEPEFEMMLMLGRRVGVTGSPAGGWPDGSTTES